MKLSSFAWIALSGGLACSACRDPHQDVSTPPPTMLHRYQNQIPTGTPLWKAKALLEKDGFTVSETASPWKGRPVGPYLLAVREDGQVVKRRWEIALLRNGDSVSRVELRSATVYP
jgi:hypothetical protein